ncbi:MAG: hypothetical protein ACI8U3_002709 [Brevundimonas sp.]|jgi:hypothetical protein
MTILLTEQDVTYFDALKRRRSEAQSPGRPVVVFRDGTSPRRNDCHSNAARWASEDHHTVPVHGWLIEADDGYHLRLAAHSLLKDKKGGLLDITPMDPFSPLFLAHDGPAETFFALLPRFNTITWPPSETMAQLPAADPDASRGPDF